MVNTVLLAGGKLASLTLQKLNLGSGSTWPGHMALKLNPHFVRDIMAASDTKVIIIAGTNGKTTSSLMLRSVLEADGKKVFHNESGANLLNGIASTLMKQSSLSGHIQADYAIFEVDENALPQVLESVTPDYLLILNLFRDQLDRYGEVATIMDKWQKSFNKLPKSTVLVVNADDPKTAYLGLERENSIYFGVATKKRTTAHTPASADSVYCPQCHHKLAYTSVTYSHLGDWRCPLCHLTKPHTNIYNDIRLSLSGTYNLYNAHGIIELSQKVGTRYEVIAKALVQIAPAFGRQEKITVQGKQVQLFLSKNPTGFNESLKTIHDTKAKHCMFLLNDNFADGTDVSWIWDIDMETYIPDFDAITISGTRCFDFALRVDYAQSKKHKAMNINIEENLSRAIEKALGNLPSHETLYILPTYTAMLEVRKLLTGRKIL